MPGYLVPISASLLGRVGRDGREGGAQTAGRSLETWENLRPNLCYDLRESCYLWNRDIGEDLVYSKTTSSLTLLSRSVFLGSIAPAAFDSFRVVIAIWASRCE